MASNLTFGQQLVSSGIVIPITADRTLGNNDTTAKVDVSLSDKVVNLIGTTMKTVTLNYSATSAKFEGLLTLEYGEIPGTNYQSSFVIGGTIRGSNLFVSNTNAVHYMAQVKDVKVDKVVPGNGSITLLCSHDGSVENDLNTLATENNAYIRICNLSGNPSAAVITNIVGTLAADTTKYSDSRKHYTVTVSSLFNETEYELAVTMVNQVGPTAASAAINAKPSLYPNALTFDTFNSLDVSGGKFNVSLDNQADTETSFKTLKLKVYYTSTQVTLPPVSTITTVHQVIDLSGMYPTGTGAKRQVEFLMPAEIKSALLTPNSAINKFSVNAYIEADISGSDISGAPMKKLRGVEVSKPYYMDRPLTISSFSLDAVNWSDGAQTLKASILGGTDISYNGVAATFDMSGITISAAPIIDLCNNVTSAKVAITYAELSAAKLSVKPTVRMSRQELNNAAVTNMSAKLELAHVLSALKRGAMPDVAFTPPPTETTKTATFKFNAATGAIADMSANTFYRVQLDEIGATTTTTVQDKTLKSVSQMTAASGETFTLFSNTIAAGMKSVLRAFTILDLSKYAPRYTELNKNEKYLTSVENSANVVFKGTPDVHLSLRPSTNTVEKLDTIRVSGNLKANNIDNMYVFGQDICGRVIFKSIDIKHDTRDICGRMMTHDGTQAGATNDFAGPFTFDIPFNNTELPLAFSAEPVYLHVVLDTTDDIDKVQVRFDISAVETDFVAKVAATYSVYDAFIAARDLSNNPGGVIVNGTVVGGDAQYKVIDASSTALALAITDLSTNIDASYNGFKNLPLLRDSSDNGGKWYYDQKLATALKAEKLWREVYEYNVTQFNTIPTPSPYDEEHLTFTMSSLRDFSDNSVGYVVSSKKLIDPSNGGILGNFDNTTNPGNYSPYNAFVSAKAAAVAARDIAFGLYLSAEVDEENAKAKLKNTTDQIDNFSSSVKVMEDKLAAYKTKQSEYTAAKQSRAAALVAAAATAKLANDSAASNLAKARLAFFDASGNVLA